MYYFLLCHGFFRNDGLHAAIVPLDQVWVASDEGGLEANPLGVESGGSLGRFLPRENDVSLVVLRPRRYHKHIGVCGDVAVGELFYRLLGRVGLLAARDGQFRCCSTGRPREPCILSGGELGQRITAFR